jgi:hypothetical protein
MLARNNVPCDVRRIKNTQPNRILMVIDVYILLETQDFRVADIRSVDERTQEQEREDWEDTKLHMLSVRAICRYFKKQVGTYRESIFNKTFLVSFSSCSPNPASSSLLRFSYISSLPIFSVVILSHLSQNRNPSIAKRRNEARDVFVSTGVIVFKHIGAAILSTTGSAVCSPRGAQMTGA